MVSWSGFEGNMRYEKWMSPIWFLFSIREE